LLHGSPLAFGVLDLNFGMNVLANGLKESHVIDSLGVVELLCVVLGVFSKTVRCIVWNIVVDQLSLESDIETWNVLTVCWICNLRQGGIDLEGERVNNLVLFRPSISTSVVGSDECEVDIVDWTIFSIFDSEAVVLEELSEKGLLVYETDMDRRVTRKQAHVFSDEWP
jgi:hypothetical protein